MLAEDRESGGGGRVRGATYLASLLTILIAAMPRAQTKCPAPAEGTVCDHFHAHLLVWQPGERTYQEVTATRQFISPAACEKWKADSAKESQSIADYMKTAKIDSSMQADRLGECH